MKELPNAVNLENETKTKPKKQKKNMAGKVIDLSRGTSQLRFLLNRHDPGTKLQSR